MPLSFRALASAVLGHTTTVSVAGLSPKYSLLAFRVISPCSPTLSTTKGMVSEVKLFTPECKEEIVAKSAFTLPARGTFPTEKMEEYDFAKAYAADATDPAAMDEAAARIRQHLGTDEEGRR